MIETGKVRGIYKCVILGKKKEAEELYEQLRFLGKFPDLIILLDLFSPMEYKSIPEVCEEKLKNLELSQCGVIIPAGIYFSEATKIVERYQEKLRTSLVREIEFFSRCVIEKADLFSKSMTINREPNGVGIGLQLGFVMGGVEAWASNLFWQTKIGDVQVRIFEPKQESTYNYVGAGFYNIPQDCVEQIGPYQFFGEYVIETLRRICMNPPKVYVDNGSYRMLAAIWIAKKVLGVNIHVVSVIHNDYDIFYQRLRIFGEVIDRVITVSKPIYNKVTSLFPDQFNDVRVKLQVPRPTDSIPAYDDGVLRIAYASRLEPSNKRSLWVCEVVDRLLSKHIKFTLDIAGDGSCRSDIERYIIENQLQNQIHLLGHISYDKMQEFWKSHNVFINFSAVEGGPLTLFESMGNGLVPIVTKAGWGEALIHCGQNGYLVVSPEDIAEKIETLSRSCEKQSAMRQRAWETMKEFYEKHENLKDIVSFE